MNSHEEARQCFPDASRKALPMKLDHRLDDKTVAGLKLPAGKNEEIFWDPELENYGCRLRVSGTAVRKTYVIQYRRAGATRRLRLGSPDRLGEKQARAAAKKALAAVALGQDPQAEKAARRNQDQFIFRAVADDYLKAKQPTVRPRTFVEMQRYLCGSYFKALHSIPADHITRRDVAARLLVIARECGVVTAIRARSHLSALFAWGIAQGLMQANPVVGASQLKPPPARDRVLDDRELAAVWSAAGDDDFGRVVRLLILLGQRRTEVGGMRWQELDLERGAWTIPNTRSKNGRLHTLPLPALALNIINSVPRMINRDCLFGERSSGGFTLWAFAKAALDHRLGHHVGPWVLHDLRRTFCTRLADLGVLPHVIEAAVNHHSGFRTGVSGIYIRSSYEREVRNALALWADHIRSITEDGERKIVPMPQRAS
jgi:integrase